MAARHLWKRNGGLFMSVTIRIAAVAGALVAVIACQSATNLDVAYKNSDAGSTDRTEPDGGDAGDAGGPVVLEGCPCDPSTGQGCCVTAKDAFCTDSPTICANEHGALLGCAHRDPLSESECCWHGSGAGALTALAAQCTGATACLADTDCAPGVKCETNTCAGFTFGACGSKPACP